MGGAKRYPSIASYGDDGFHRLNPSHILRTGIGRDDLIDACVCAVAARDSTSCLAGDEVDIGGLQWRPIADEGRAVTRKQPVGQISVQPRSEKYFASPFGRNSFIDSNHPTPQEGRIMIVTDAGRDAVDAAALGARRDAGRVRKDT